ncbi:hypothetical protein TREES_T100015691 [Tupaia chinensis]|uniref:Uncharacterized protein n=1 Tax=Tupaia chinensis TaxID=246437 RepID=L9LB90_TUPCH|nr:hypothetical protein TREES_T100015691 [Tupaia chinensis]
MPGRTVCWAVWSAHSKDGAQSAQSGASVAGSLGGGDGVLLADGVTTLPCEPPGKGGSQGLPDLAVVNVTPVRKGVEAGHSVRTVGSGPCMPHPVLPKAV